MPVASPELIEELKAILKNHCPASTSTVTITSAAYYQISVAADVFVTSSSLASEVKFNTIRRLQEFLHPIRGGIEGKGWQFGKMPGKPDIMAFFQSTLNVDHVEGLSVTLIENTRESHLNWKILFNCQSTF